MKRNIFFPGLARPRGRNLAPGKIFPSEGRNILDISVNECTPDHEVSFSLLLILPSVQQEGSKFSKSQFC
jgi:hypothetical protein